MEISQKKTKPIEAVVEQGRLKLLQRLPLKEQQHVWVTILPAEELHAQQIAQLAAKSPSFQFLADPTEDVYSLHDVHPPPPTVPSTVD